MKKTTLSLMILFLFNSILSYSQDFNVTVPSTDSYSHFIRPLKAGSSHELIVNVKNLRTETCTVTINELDCGQVTPWVSVTTTNYEISPNQTQGYTININIPTYVTDNEYIMELNFLAEITSTNTALDDFNHVSQIFIVDNSDPIAPGISTSATSTTIYVYGFNSWDLQSKIYTDANDGFGIDGIESYEVYLENLSGDIIKSETIEPDQYHTHTFTNLASNYSYIAGVTATDLAGNTSSSETNVITAPAAPALSSPEKSYCSISLEWNSVDGAVSYNIYNLVGTASTLLGNTTSTTYTVTNLTHASTYSFFIHALSNTGHLSDRSNTLVIPTLTIPVPVITGSNLVCSSGTSFTVNNKPDECSLSWVSGPSLTLYSTNGNTAIFKSTGNYADTWVKAIYDSGCGTEDQDFDVDAGSPAPGPITILWDVPPRRFTAYIEPIASATSYKWYLDGVLKHDSQEYDVIFARQIWNCGHIYDVDVVAVNSCGTSALTHTEVMEDPCGYSFVIFPNPATSEITVSQNNDKLAYSEFEQLEPKTINSITIIDKFGIKYFEKQFNNDTKDAKINISKLKTGSYIVIINGGEDAESYTILKN